MYGALRRFLNEQGYTEVETPALVPAPGMEPHITAFETRFIPETNVGRARTLYLHTSPEYAMKRLLADGGGPIFQICKVFRNGEVSRHHNPEFSMLELYRPRADYREVMADLEAALAEAEAAVAWPGERIFSKTPYARLTVRDAFRQEAGIDLYECESVSALAKAAAKAGVRLGGAKSFDDVFFQIFLQRIEPKLGHGRPAYLVDYPASMAALSRLKPKDPRVAERFELYVQGAELANGFSELTDRAEQRRRLVQEQAERKNLGRPVYPLDEAFLKAVGRMPPSGGVAVGLDRVLMLMLGAEELSEVLLFPAEAFV
jgi:elongation factor P--(R)-beta-lysine ligase